MSERLRIAIPLAAARGMEPGEEVRQTAQEGADDMAAARGLSAEPVVFVEWVAVFTAECH